MVWTVLVLEERMKKKVALHNLGCKVNSYELEAMQQLLEQAGYEDVYKRQVVHVFAHKKK